MPYNSNMTKPMTISVCRYEYSKMIWSLHYKIILFPETDYKKSQLPLNFFNVNCLKTMLQNKLTLSEIQIKKIGKA